MNGDYRFRGALVRDLNISRAIPLVKQLAQCDCNAGVRQQKAFVAQLQQRLGHEDVRVLAADEPIRIEGGTRRGQDLWKLFGWCVMGCLLLEQLILAWPMLGKAKQ